MVCIQHEKRETVWSSDNSARADRSLFSAQGSSSEARAATLGESAGKAAKKRSFLYHRTFSESRSSWKKGKGVRPLPLSAFIIALLFKRTKSGPFFSYKLKTFFCDVSCKVNNAVRVAAFVIVPRDYFYHAAFHNHCRKSIDCRRVFVSVVVARN